ncbi:ABC transporter ATP-binding protein [Haloferula chungangensis]|uniref:ABC transporter ATP-binding protein n=1 Tax=Haloferula chungangensis TaxID=1048331 RepID=A0ABW2LDJ5_9BACT
MLLRLLQRTARYRDRAILVFILAVIGTALVLVLPAIAKQFTDVVIEEKRKDLVIPTALVGLGAIILRQILLSLRSLAAQSLEARLVHDLRVELYDKLQRLPVRWFDKNASGEVMSRVADDVPAMDRVIVEGLDTALAAILQFTLILAALFMQDWKLALVTVAPLPIIGVITYFYSRFSEPRWRESSEASAALHSQLHDSLSGIRQIKVYTDEPEALSRFEEASHSSRRSYMRVMKGQAIVWPGISMLAECGIIAMVAYGSWRVINEEISAGVLFYFLFAWGFIFDPISKINPLTQVFNRGLVSAKRVFEILDRPEEHNLVEGARPESVRGAIRFEDVSFAYDDEAPAIEHVSFDAAPGQTIALVGPTGAGKSTLLHLLARFYEPSSGRILLDGQPLDTLSKEWLRDHTGYVTQESFLFNTTLRENLLLAKHDASDDELWSVLESANAADFIRELPDDLGTLAGERGIRFSGGEKQRLSIARALLKNPPILLLDEATSALDNETERLVQEALEHLRAERTSFVIAHRLSTVHSADLICVLEDGRLVQAGRHEDLVTKDGLYARLCQATMR